MARGRPKGSPKTPGSGRKKGTPNKATRVQRQMLELMKVDGSDPMSFCLSIMQNKEAPYEERKWAVGQLMPYAHPKLSSIEARTGGKSHEDRLTELQDMIGPDGQLLIDHDDQGGHRGS